MKPKGLLVLSVVMGMAMTFLTILFNGVLYPFSIYLTGFLARSILAAVVIVAIEALDTHLVNSGGEPSDP